MEIQQRPGDENQLIASPDVVRFESLRDDWVKGADLLTRLIFRSAQGELVLQGFPQQWIPLFVHFGVCFTAPSPPVEYLSLVSEVSAEHIELLSRQAGAKGALREMVEAFASLDPLIADVLHRIDRRNTAASAPSAVRVKLTGWQSYGRPEILQLNKLIADTAVATHETAVLLPCARRRPYQSSKTHRRIWEKLKLHGVDPIDVDRLVVSSIGIVPEYCWDHPVVLGYDFGVPDIYRILRLMRQFFKKARYSRVIDCLEFQPYSDCLQIVSREGLVDVILPLPCGRVKKLPAP